nr:MAG TPA_asm: hypothetical protein [Caudoviricetes sp.]
MNHVDNQVCKNMVVINQKVIGVTKTQRGNCIIVY